MKSKIIFTIIISMIIQTAYSQDEEDTMGVWKYGGLFHTGFSQVGLKNWAGGGENLLTVNSLANIFANIEYERSIWENQFEAGYGLSRHGKTEAPFRKSDDRLLLVSKFSFKLNEKSAITSIMDFRTQFDKGYMYFLDSNDVEQQELTSTFMAPAYLMFAIGYEYRPYENMYYIISPISSKTTMVLNDQIAELGNYGLEVNENFKTEIGISFIAFTKLQLLENMEFQNRLFLFTPYEQIDKVDVNWETMLNFKINKILQLNISTQLIYDKNIDITSDDGTVGPQVQFKHVMSIGLSLQYSNE